MTPPPWSTDLALLTLRLGAGGLMLVNHGLGKLGRLTRGEGGAFADPLGVGPELSLALATGAEVGAAALLTLGLLTRLATLPLAFTMAVAAFVVHGGDPLPDKEPALLFLATYLALFVLGPGRISASQALAGVLPRKGALAFLLR